MKPDITWKMRVIDPFISCKKIQADITFSNFQNEMTAYSLFGWANFWTFIHYNVLLSFYWSIAIKNYLGAIKANIQVFLKGLEWHLQSYAFTPAQALKFGILASYIWNSSKGDKKQRLGMAFAKLCLHACPSINIWNPCLIYLELFERRQ